MSTNFEKVRDLNIIAGNPASSDWNDLISQAKIILLEWKETVGSVEARDHHTLRDDITDLLVTIYGLGARAGFDVDTDMTEVMAALYTRFDRTPEDAQKTAELYKSWGVETYLHVDSKTHPGVIYYVTKSAHDQTGLNKKGKEEFYPAHKFLKSYQFRTEQFAPLPEAVEKRLEESKIATAGIEVDLS